MLIIAKAGAAIFTTIEDSAEVVFSGHSFLQAMVKPTENMRNMTITLIMPLIKSILLFCYNSSLAALEKRQSKNFSLAKPMI